MKRKTPPQKTSQPWVLGILIFALGAAIILIGLGVIPVDPESIHAPGWVIACAGAIFALGGVIISVENVKGLDWLGVCCFGLILTAFAVVFDWIAFWPGEREFTSSGNIPIPFLSGGLSGRIAFGCGGVLMTLVAVIMWYWIIRSWIRVKGD